MKKFFAKLVNWSGQREDYSESRFQADQEDRAKIGRARNEQMTAGHNPKYASDRKLPAEEDILGPSDSGLKGEK
jgi:hypothetical protein